MGDSKTANAPPGWENWRAERDGAPEGAAAEYPLYSDSLWTGEITSGLGPYQVLNMIGGGMSPQVGRAYPALALRVGWHLPEPDYRVDVPDKPKTGSYHGGWVDDELAALLSLALNVRCRSGGMWRDFGHVSSDDVRGRPLAFRLRPPPLVPPQEDRAVIPQIARSVGLEDARPLLTRYPDLWPRKARGLARAARVYQRALWAADDDPRYAWLQLFAALETAALAWSGEKGDERERISEAWPELDELLGRTEESVRTKLAKLLAPLVKAQFRSLRFIEAFCPPPPAERSAWPIDWDAMNKHFRALYARRSEALHAGVPIPEPLCVPPRREEPGWDEAPGGLAVSMGDATWPSDSIPMLLWLFAYVVGGAIREWWATA